MWQDEVRSWAKQHGFYGREIEDSISEAKDYACDGEHLEYAIRWMGRERAESIREARAESFCDRCRGFTR